MNLRKTYQILMIARFLGVQRWPKWFQRSFRHNRMPLFWIVVLVTFVVLWGRGCTPIPQWGPLAMQTDLCQVIRVVDGDGVRLNCGPGRENLNVRLHCIDAPETDQTPWGSMATRHLEKLLGPTVQLVVVDTDRYGRTIGRLVSEGVDLNRRLVFDGMVAVYPQYCSDPRYYQAERDARRNDRGIWAEPGLHQRPWEWRKK